MSATGSGKSIFKHLRARAGRLYSSALNSCAAVRGGFCMRRCAARRAKLGLRNPIQVGFLAQTPEVWDKQISLFEFMQKDPRFAPHLIYVPHLDYVQYVWNETSEVNPEEKAFFENLYGRENIISYFETPSLDLSQFDYLFYDRPYNQLFPEPLQTSQAVRFARLCIINYGSDDWDLPFWYTPFAVNIHLWFASNTHEYVLHQGIFGHSRYHKAFDIGYPAYELYRSLPAVPGKNRILWTPRWSYDPTVGGSHFFEYVRQMIDFAAHHNDVSLVIRPHPLMFSNLIQEKKMTEEDVRNLKQECADLGIRFDANQIITETFKETDILVSDYSSVLSLFLSTGKPIIYCPGSIPLNEECLRQVDTMYTAESWAELEQALLGLLDGRDPKKNARQAVMAEPLRKASRAAASIADVVWQDYNA